MIRNKQLHQLLRFGISGVAGFVVDASIVALSTKIIGVGPFLAQIISFGIAVTVTWLINRHWTFSQHASDKWLQEFGRYIAVNSIGAVANNSVYAVLVLTAATFSKDPVLAVAAGSVAGIVFNYSSSTFWVFNAHDSCLDN